ncbi:conserved hypothetical protein [Ricinus communis]|uniref:DUF4283 domain-containing protein n=1 Tax=Ricinus communis TaxID=3988 RepID=B9SXV6_RICCO|nr:conserved hypothetical protein [Ricinus communis]
MDGDIVEDFPSQVTESLMERNDNISLAAVRFPLSFKDILMKNGTQRPQGPLDQDIADFSNESNVKEDLNKEDDCLTIRVSSLEKIRLRKSWNQCLIIKLWGKIVGYNFLVRRIKQLCFIIFMNMNLGPRHMPNSDPCSASVDKVAIWVRILNLPLEYFNEDFLLRLEVKIDIRSRFQALLEEEIEDLPRNGIKINEDMEASEVLANINLNVALSKHFADPATEAQNHDKPKTSLFRLLSKSLLTT